MNINRCELLECLESVSPGLTTLKETVAQSGSFVFRGGRVYTFNGEVACSRKTGLDITGSVDAKPLRETLNKWGEEDIDIEAEEGELLLSGAPSGTKRRAGIRMEAEIQLPFDCIPTPQKGDWKELPATFTEAVGLVQPCCAGKNEARHALRCIKLSKKEMEACDSVQAARYVLSIPVADTVYVKGDGVKSLVSFGITKVADLDGWLCFRNPVGLTVSLGKYTDEEFPDLDKAFTVEGTKLNLSPRIAEVLEKAEIFSVDSADENQVVVQVKAKVLKIRGSGLKGWYSEPFPIEGYKGQDFAFRIAPKLLATLAKVHSHCTINPERLMVEAENYKYVVGLDKVESGK